MLRYILTAWRPVALAALLALAAAPTDVQAAGHSGGGFHGGGYHGGGAYHGGSFHTGGYGAGYHNAYGQDHRGYGNYGGYYSPWLYGSPAYTSAGYDLPPDFYYSPEYTSTLPGVGQAAYYTPDAPPPAPAVAAPTAVPNLTPSGPATVDVHVPASAQVWFDDSPTTQTGDQRRYASPSLDPGRDYSYAVRARWTDDGKVVDETRRITVHANNVSSVDFTQPAPAASASK